MQIRNALNQELSYLVFDKNLLNKIYKLETGFVNKNESHIKFFGGNLTGVEIVRFTPTDRTKLFEELLNVDEIQIEELLLNLKTIDDKEYVLNKEFIISSDSFNLTCVWLMHSIQNSQYLSDRDKKEGRVRICMYLYYKFLTSLLVNFFRYPADESIAKATYANLSKKYILKQKETWLETIRYLAENTTGIEKDNIHKNVILKMDNDKGVINLLNDAQGRVRDMVKNICSEFHNNLKLGNKIVSDSSVIETDGELILKDRKHSLGAYSTYIKTIVADKNSFIKKDLIDIIVSIMKNMSDKNLYKVLEWTSNNAIENQQIPKVIDEVMEHAFDYLSANKSFSNKTDLVDIISRLRGTYMSSRASDVKLLDLRKNALSLINNSISIKNDNMIVSLRTGWCIYVFLRAITKDHYAK